MNINFLNLIARVQGQIIVLIYYTYMHVFWRKKYISQESPRLRTSSRKLEFYFKKRFQVLLLLLNQKL